MPPFVFLLWERERDGADFEIQISFATLNYFFCSAQLGIRSNSTTLPINSCNCWWSLANCTKRWSSFARRSCISCWSSCVKSRIHSVYIFLNISPQILHSHMFFTLSLHSHITAWPSSSSARRLFSFALTSAQAREQLACCLSEFRHQLFFNRCPPHQFHLNDPNTTKSQLGQCSTSLVSLRFFQELSNQAFLTSSSLILGIPVPHALYLHST